MYARIDTSSLPMVSSASRMTAHLPVHHAADGPTTWAPASAWTWAVSA
ncbi:hypothetical protein STANM309S_02990 [Streptomyces tanashiensis]